MSANDKREHKPCMVCKHKFWGWPVDRKCILCRSPMEDAISIDATFNSMSREQENSGNHKG